jgi:hypothetical protein
MSDDDAEALLRRTTDDIRASIRWLLDNGYTLTRVQTSAGQVYALVYGGQAEVIVSVDRSQWFLEIARTPGAPPIQFDLLVAAQRGQTYWDCFPRQVDPGSTRLPEQLPPGVSWRNTLPDVLMWIGGPDVTEMVDRARDQRYVVMWPESHKAKQLRRFWRAQGLPTAD